MKYSDRPNAYINAKDLEIAIVKATTYGDALSALREAPSIDIVRCKECKHWEGEERQGFYYFEVCSRTQLDALCDDFCSYGERRE